MRLRALALSALCLCLTLPTYADDSPLVRLTFRPFDADGTLGEERTSDGKIISESDDGLLVLLDRGGRLWPLTPGQISAREETGETFAPYSREEMVEELKREFGDGFLIVTTRHYVLCSEAGRDYARWAGSLFERLMAAFEHNWGRKPLKFEEPEFPLCAVILKDELSFRRFALEDAGPGVLDAKGYYSTLTNRMVMYDLTAGLNGRRPQNELEYNVRLLGQMDNVSTIVHEATHQIAFNGGLHVRMASNPLWLVEGMAMFFETPDLQGAGGWRTVGKLNGNRLATYRDYVNHRRKPGSLRSMLTDDERFQADARTAVDAYSEAWALTYYLIKNKRSQYTSYLAGLSEKRPMEQNPPEIRLAEFEAAFGKVEDVEKALEKYMASPRLK